jgi:hypothetical protein
LLQPAASNPTPSAAAASAAGIRVRIMVGLGRILACRPSPPFSRTSP